MSKGNMLLGQARGRVGSLVFARRSGEQITRTYSAQVKNPKTRAQMVQRVQWPNLVNMWRLLKPYLQKGMQGKKANQSDFNAFMSRNISLAPAYLTKGEARAGATVLSEYIITSGTLGALQMGDARTTPFKVLRGFVGTDFPDLTIGEFSQMFIQANPSFAVGDQVTFFLFGQLIEGSIPVVRVNALKFVLTDSSDTRTFAGAAEVVGDISLNTDEGNAYIIIENNNTNYMSFATAVVHSRLENGTLRVSESRMYVSYAAGGGGQQGVGFGVSLDEALASYGFAEDAYLSPNSAEYPVLISGQYLQNDVLEGALALDGGSYVVTAKDPAIATVTGEYLKEGAIVATYGGVSCLVQVISPVKADVTFTIARGDEEKELIVKAGDSVLSAKFTAQNV